MEKPLTFAEVRVMADLECDGWTVHRHGWPDFLATKRGHRPRLIEVKSATDRLQENQATVIDALAVLGIEVEIATPDGTFKRGLRRPSERKTVV